MRKRLLYRCFIGFICGACFWAATAPAQTPAAKALKAAQGISKQAKPGTGSSARTTPLSKEAAGAVQSDVILAPPESPGAYREARYMGVNRRDPFLNPLLLKKKENPDTEELPRGQALPGIAGMYIAQVTLLGTSVGEDSRTAVFQGTDQRVYFLHTGDRLYDGYVQSVSSDAVLLVRETTFRSGQTVREEVTKRLRTP
jgi:hypothetical protein